MKKARFIVFGTFILAGIALLLLTLFLKNDFYLVSLLLLLLAVSAIIGAYFDPHINEYLRVAFVVIGLLFFIASMLGLLLKEDIMSVSIYCLVLAILEIINGVAKCIESYEMLKEKNYMGIAFAIDALFEIVIGALMVFEKDATLHLHSTLISGALMYEGIIKLINEYIEDKRDLKE